MMTTDPSDVLYSMSDLQKVQLERYLFANLPSLRASNLVCLLYSVSDIFTSSALGIRCHSMTRAVGMDKKDVSLTGLALSPPPATQRCSKHIWSLLELERNITLKLLVSIYSHSCLSWTWLSPLSKR